MKKGVSTTIMLENGEPMALRIDALTCMAYRMKYGRKLAGDMEELAAAFWQSSATGTDLFTADMVRRYAGALHCMARSASPEIPKDLSKWLEKAEGVSIWAIGKAVFELWERYKGEEDPKEIPESPDGRLTEEARGEICRRLTRWLGNCHPEIKAEEVKVRAISEDPMREKTQAWLWLEKDFRSVKVWEPYLKELVEIMQELSNHVEISHREISELVFFWKLPQGRFFRTKVERIQGSMRVTEAPHIVGGTPGRKATKKKKRRK